MGCVSRAFDPQSRITSVSSISRYETVLLPAPKDCRQTDDTGGMSSPVATIDIVAPYYRANKLLGNIVQLVRGL